MQMQLISQHYQQVEVKKITMSLLKRLLSKPIVKGLIGFSTLGTITYLSYNQLYPNQSQAPASQSEPQSTQIQVKDQALNNQESSPQTVEQSSSKESQEVVTVVEEKKEQAKVEQSQHQQKAKESQPIPLSSWNKINQMVQFKFQPNLTPGEMILVVADLPYTPDFEAKIVAQVNALKSQYKSLKVYRKDILESETKKKFQKEFRTKIDDQTIFLLRNSYDKGFNYINFDIFMQYPSVLPIYLREPRKFEQSNIAQLKSQLIKLSPYGSSLFYLYDSNEPQQKQRERMMASKFIEMELALSNLNGVKLLVVDKNTAVKAGLIDSQNSRANSLHLFRKHNIYTPFDPNFNLQDQNQQNVPFYRLSDIPLFYSNTNKLAIPSLLSGLQTFDSSETAAPFLCNVRVDKNRISEQDYSSLLKIFGQLKRSNRFPDVSFALKLREVPYAGRDRPKNQEWQIHLVNTDEMDRQSMMHEITNHDQLKTLGFTQEQFLKTRPEYIYQHTVIDRGAIEQFLEKGMKGKLEKYYRSQQQHPLSNIRKTTSVSFEKDVLSGDKDHIVYEYSEYCPTCKKISPIVSVLSEYLEAKGHSKHIEFYKLNANKNRVRGQPSSPYIPNIYYFKKEWGSSPARFPIELLSSQGISSLYHFYLINREVQTVPWKLIDQAVEQQQQYKGQLIKL